MDPKLSFDSAIVLALANEGLRQSEIARRVGVSQGKISRFLRKMGFRYQKGPKTQWGEKKIQQSLCVTPTAARWAKKNRDLIERMARNHHTIIFDLIKN